MIQLIGYSLLEMRIRDADEEGGDDDIALSVPE